MNTSLAPEHAAARLGRVTASRLHEALAKTKTGWGASRANYAADLIAERLTGQPVDRYVSPDMKRGIRLEPEACAAYEYRFDVDVLPLGFVPHPTLALSGASPDGGVHDDGLVEFKCPKTAGHIDLLMGDPFAEAYVIQACWQLECTGRTWCDLVSFCPDLPPALQLHVTRIVRDDARLAEMRTAVMVFLGEIETKLDYLRAKYLAGAA